jgi:hypothetical protein
VSGLQEISRQVAAITNTAPFCYTSAPTPTSKRFVCQGGTFTTEAEAYAHLHWVLLAAEAGEELPEGYSYACKVCAETFQLPATREVHEHAKHGRRERLACGQ